MGDECVRMTINLTYNVKGNYKHQSPRLWQMEIPCTALDLLSNSYTESCTHLPHVSRLRESLSNDITPLEVAFYCPLKKM